VRYQEFDQRCHPGQPSPFSGHPLASFRFRHFLPLICLCGLLPLLGCGSSGGGKLLPVSGKVTLKGSPLTGGHIAFHPDLDKGNKGKGVPTGSIGADGTYKLSTEGKAGAPAGWYKISVATNFPGMEGTPVPINSKYNSPTTSGLTCEVVPNAAAGAYDLQLAN
jgi:hypothetical protein